MEILKTLRKIDVYKHEYNSVFDLKIYHVNDDFYAFIQELIAYTSEQPKRVNYEVQVDEKIWWYFSDYEEYSALCSISYKKHDVNLGKLNQLKITQVYYA